jgi:hypothetical protein
MNGMKRSSFFFVVTDVEKMNENTHFRAKNFFRFFNQSLFRVALLSYSTAAASPDLHSIS